MRLVLNIFASVSIALCQPVGAAPSVPTREYDRAIRFQADHDSPPFSIDDPAAGPIGYDVDLFREVAARAGLAADVSLDDWQAIQDRLRGGSVDVVPMLVTPERKRRLLFTQPYLQRYHMVYGMRGGQYVRSLEELSGRRVAVQRSGRAAEALAAVPGVRIVLVEKEGDSLREVAGGRADFAIAPDYIALHARRRFKLAEVVPLSPPILTSDYAFALPPDRVDLKFQLDRGLEEVFRSGEADRIFLTWLGNLTPESESYRAGMKVGLWFVVPLVAITVFLLLRWRRMRKLAVAAGQMQQIAEDEVHRVLHHDQVTGGVNAAGLHVKLIELIANGQPFTLIRIDLLGLQQTEAITGHAFVDQLLRSMGEQLRSLKDRPVMASVGQGTFYIACLAVVDVPAAERAMDELITLAGQRIYVDGIPVESSSNAGAAIFPLHGTESGSLMRAATIACSIAASTPGTGVVYRPDMDPDPRNLTLLTDLREAIAGNRLGFALQAKFDVSSDSICGAEMLVRWDHPQHGPLPPSHFVPLAERTEVIGEMTLYLLERALDLCRKWTDEEFALELAVNVSANDLVNPAIVSMIVERVRSSTSRLVLEITETAVMRDPERALAAVQELRQEGIRISLDDFGTGNASLTYLRKLLPDEVKIDRSFITSLLTSSEDQSIVRSTIDLAHSFGAKVTAEGVEDAETLRWLKATGADAAQGFGLARPESVAAFEERFRRHPTIVAA